MKHRYTNKSDLPPLIHDWLTHDEHWRHPDAYCSVTDLCEPQWKRYLVEKWQDQSIDGRPVIQQDSSEFWARQVGSAWHADVAKIAEDSERYASEIRLQGDVGGRLVSGTLDLFDYATKRIIDLKSASVWTQRFFYENGHDKPGGKWFEWRLQLSLYALLFESLPFPSRVTIDTTGEIWLWMRDWQRAKARSGDHPPSAFDKFEIPLLSREKTLEIATERIAEFERYKAGASGQCSENERWSKGDKVAVRKSGRKTALRLLPSYDAAVAYCESNGLVKAVESDGKPVLATGITIEEKPLSDRRCNDHCEVSHRCDYYQRKRLNAGAAVDPWYLEIMRAAEAAPGQENGESLDSAIPY